MWSTGSPPEAIRVTESPSLTGRPRHRRRIGLTGSLGAYFQRAWRRVTVWLLLMVLAIGVVLGYVLTVVRPASLRLDSAEEALMAAREAIVQQEMSVQGYVLRPEPGLLGPYRAAVAEVARLEARAQRDLAFDGPASAQLAAVRTAQQRWEEWATATLSNPPDAALLAASLATDTSLFDAYRVRQAALESRIRALRESLATTGAWLLLIALAFTLAAGTAVSVGALRERRRLRALLLDPVAEIVKATERIASNQPDAWAAVSGPEEFRRIATGVNEIALALGTYKERLQRESAQMLAEAQGRAALEERTHLAQELHDSISQILFSMTLQLRAAELTLRKEGLDPGGSLADHLVRLRELTNSALAEARALIFELRPGALRDEGLVAALRKQAARIAASDGILVEVDAQGERVAVHPAVEEQLYRIGQEALYNIMKHAHAARVRIRLTEGSGQPGGAEAGDGLTLEISDDGVGFDPSLLRPGHLGLQTMAQRVERLGGQFSLESAPGVGTTVRVLVPSLLGQTRPATRTPGVSSPAPAVPPDPARRTGEPVPETPGNRPNGGGPAPGEPLFGSGLLSGANRPPG